MKQLTKSQIKYRLKKDSGLLAAQFKYLGYAALLRCLVEGHNHTEVLTALISLRDLKFNE